MPCTNSKSLAQHIIEHEILGVGTSNGPSGDLTVVNGVPVFNDPVRNKQLSISRDVFYGTKKGRAKDVYLFTGNNVNLRKTGLRMPLNSTIVAASVQNSSLSTFTFHIRKNNSEINLYSISTVDSLGSHDKLANVD